MIDPGVVAKASNDSINSFIQQYEANPNGTNWFRLDLTNGANGGSSSVSYNPSNITQSDIDVLKAELDKRKSLQTGTGGYVAQQVVAAKQQQQQQSLANSEAIEQGRLPQQTPAEQAQARQDTYGAGNPPNGTPPNNTGADFTQQVVDQAGNPPQSAAEQAQARQDTYGAGNPPNGVPSNTGADFTQVVDQAGKKPVTGDATGQADFTQSVVDQAGKKPEQEAQKQGPISFASIQKVNQTAPKSDPNAQFKITRKDGVVVTFDPVPGKPGMYYYTNSDGSKGGDPNYKPPGQQAPAGNGSNAGLTGLMNNGETNGTTPSSSGGDVQSLQAEVARLNKENAELKQQLGNKGQSSTNNSSGKKQPGFFNSILGQGEGTRDYSAGQGYQGFVNRGGIFGHIRDFISDEDLKDVNAVLDRRHSY